MIRKIIRKVLEESLFSVLNEIGEFNYNVTFTPPIDVINTCKEAIQNSGSNLEKAVDLSNGVPQSYNQIKKLRDFFAKNIENKDSNWNLHGGDAGKNWVENELEKFHKNSVNRNQNIQRWGGAGEKKGKGIFDINPLDINKGRNNIR